MTRRSRFPQSIAFYPSLAVGERSRLAHEALLLTPRLLVVLLLSPLLLLMGTSLACSSRPQAPDGEASAPSAGSFASFVSTLSGDAVDQDAAVANYLAQHGPTPLMEDGGRVVFLVDPGEWLAAQPESGASVALERGAENGPRGGGDDVRLLADFNGWGWEEVPAEERRLEPVGRSGWRWKAVQLEPGARVEYAYAVGERVLADPHNPRRVAGWEEDVSLLTLEPREAERIPGLHALLSVEEGQPELPALDAERLEVFEHVSSFLPGTRRRVQIYRPVIESSESASSEFGASEPLPTVYFGDGSAYAGRGRVPQMLDALIAAGVLRPLIAVFVDPVDRYREYRRHSGFRRMMVEEIVPRVDASYPTLQDPSGRLLVGGSRGALAAVDLAHTHPQVFGHVAAIAPAVSGSDLVSTIAESPRVAMDPYVLIGRYDRRWAPDGYALAEALRSAGYSPTVVEVPEGHSLTAWRLRLPAMLEHFFPGPEAR
ncbi:MAG: alpha/beta hydrolase-fold protein [Acidobacteriota bacterium]